MAMDPAQNVAEQLLPHIHLVSTFRYPTMARVDLQEVTKWLYNAPKIAQHQAPFYWTYIDSPKDGSILLTWQPLNRLGTEFASDGYVWGGPETYFQQDVGNGLVLEIFYHRVGYRPGETYALHARRRFRLVPSKNNAGNASPQVDPGLWIVHYGPCEPNERLPVQMIQPDPRQQDILRYRVQLQRAGQIVRKEFMLSDRVNWPQIPLPREARQPMYPGQQGMRGIPPQMAYPPHPGQPHPAGKRSRHATLGGAPPQGMTGMPPQLDSGYDDDEDTSRGDLFDHLTPRELSLDRYKQNHEWMEEIVSSAYRMDQITPADLGLGLKGDLAALTDGVFEAQGGDALSEEPKKKYVGRLDKGVADGFRSRVAEKIESTKAEIAKMKEEHEKMLAKFKASSLISQAERDLRSSVEDSGPEFWRLEGRIDEGEESGGRGGNAGGKTVDSIVASVDAALGKHVEMVQDVKRIQDGGYQEPEEPEPEPDLEPEPAMETEAAPEESGSLEVPRNENGTGPISPASGQASHVGTPRSGVMIGDSDIDMGGTAAGLLDQMHTGFSNTSTPNNNFPTPQAQTSALPSAAPTPANLAAPSPQPGQPTSTAPEMAHGNGAEDIAMDDADNAPTGSDTAADQGTGSGEWVMVPKGGESAPSPEQATAGGLHAQAATVVEQTLQPAAAAGSGISKPVSAAPTPATGGEGDNNDFSDLASLGNGAEDLANYDPPNLGETPGAELGMEMEDSAFGNAYIEHQDHGDDHDQDAGAHE